MLNSLKTKSEFSRNVLTLMTGTTIAQAIPIAISPILTRIYTPEEFGIFALYMGIASVISVFATGRYELAIMIPKKDEDAINIVVLSLAISIIVSFISFLLVFIFNSQITNFLKNPEISTWLYFLPFTVVLTGIYQSLNYWSNRKKQYKRLAVSRIIQSSCTGATNIAMGFSGFNSSGLILGGLLGQSVSTSILSRMIIKEGKIKSSKINILKMIALAKKYKKFPFINLPNALIDGFRLLGISILIAKFFTTASLGQFSLAWKMVQTPMTLMGGALSQVFFQKISRAKDNELKVIVKAFIINASLIAFPIFLFIYLFALDLFIIIFGENWKSAGEIASIMAPWLFLNFISSPMANVFLVLNKQEIVLIVSIFYMIIPISILFIFNKSGILHVIHLITISMSCVLVIFIALALFFASKGKK